MLSIVQEQIKQFPSKHFLIVTRHSEVSASEFLQDLHRHVSCVVVSHNVVLVICSEDGQFSILLQEFRYILGVLISSIHVVRSKITEADNCHINPSETSECCILSSICKQDPLSDTSNEGTFPKHMIGTLSSLDSTCIGYLDTEELQYICVRLESTLLCSPYLKGLVLHQHNLLSFDSSVYHVDIF